jgi:hypothetical protein
MGFIDTFTKRKEEKNLTLEDSYRALIKSNVLRIYLDSPNKVVAEEIAHNLKKDKDKATILKILDSFIDKKWWFATEPEELAVQQLKLGKENLILDSSIFIAAVFCVTGKFMSYDKIVENWDNVWKDVQEKLGEEKIKEITYTEEDWQRETDEAMTIDWN